MKILIAFFGFLVLSVSALASTSFQVQSASPVVQTLGVHRYSYNFGRVMVNSPAYVNFVVTNTGDTNLTFQNATIGGAGYDASHTCTGVLAPGQKCGVEIRFMPFFVGFQTGQFILSFAEDVHMVVDLWGEGYRM